MTSRSGGQRLLSRYELKLVLLVCVIHSSVIGLALTPSVRTIPMWAPDTSTYVRPAENLLASGEFSRETEPPFLHEPYRTIGYPLLIALALLIFGRVEWVMLFAIVTAGLAAWAAIRLTAEWGGNTTARVVAGVVAAFLPNSLGLSSQLLTDAIAGHLTVVWIYVLYLTCKQASLWHGVVATGLLIALQSLKPTYNIAALIILAAGLLWARTTRQWLVVTLLLALSLPFPVVNARRNFVDHGIYSGSLLGMETAREYLLVRALAEDTGNDYESLTELVRDQDKREAAALTDPPSAYGRRYIVQRDKVSQFMRDQPVRVAELLVVEMVRQFAAPQEFAFQVFFGELPAWARSLGSLLTLAFWALAGLGGYSLWKAGAWQPAALIALVLFFFLATGSISHHVGARLRFPADMASIPLIAIGIERLLLLIHVSPHGRIVA